MMVLDECSDLRRDFCSIPSHDQRLTNCPMRVELVFDVNGATELWLPQTQLQMRATPNQNETRPRMKHSMLSC